MGFGLDRGLRLGRFADGNVAAPWWVAVVRVGVDTICLVSLLISGSFDSSAAYVRSPLGAIDPCLDSSTQTRRRRAGVETFTAWTMVCWSKATQHEV